MITLSQAFRLCDIKDEIIYLRAYDEEPDRPFGRGHFMLAKTVREKIDMKKIMVHKILPAFSYDGFEGLTFVVSGISKEKLQTLKCV